MLYLSSAPFRVRSYFVVEEEVEVVELSVVPFLFFLCLLFVFTVVSLPVEVF